MVIQVLSTVSRLLLFIRTLYNLWNNATVGYTPTFIVSYGSQWGENFWYDRTNVWENERLLSYTPGDH